MVFGITKKHSFFQLSLFRTNRRRPSSDSSLLALWKKIRHSYFPERPDLDSYAVYWSRRRQKRVLGSCSITKKCVSVAKELRNAECERWLEPLLYHEMCHAVLGDRVGYRGRKRAWHGTEFRSLEKRHPGIPALDQWIRSGGWSKAVRSERTRAFHAKRRVKNDIETNIS